MASWDEKLLTAARKGNKKEVESCVKNRANLECRSDDIYGQTPLLWAAERGHLEVVMYLISHGSQLEATDTMRGMTPLMLAAEEGHLEVVMYLISHGSQLEATSTYDGKTALHYAAGNGHIDVTKLLLDQGCSPWVKTEKGETPYDMVTMESYDSEEIKRKKKEVMDFLKTAMSKTSQELTPDNQSQEPAAPVVGDDLLITAVQQSLDMGYTQDQIRDALTLLRQRRPDHLHFSIHDILDALTGRTTREAVKQIDRSSDEVPTEIKLMTDKRSVELYLKLLQSGSEKKRDIRLVIVGKKGAGKTSLIKRLFGEDNTDVTSTNGIEIRTIKCKAMSDDGVWNKLDGTNEEAEIHARLLKQYKGTIEESVEDETHEAVTDNTLIESKVSETVSGQSEISPVYSESTVKPQVSTESTIKPPVTNQQPNQSIEEAKKDIETMLKSNVDLNDKEEYATLLLWDFAGDEEFYHTHQTFLSPDAIYLVVTKLNEADDKKAKDLFQLWMDSIHCYSRLEEDRNKSDVNKRTSDDLDPPIVIVGTWKDALICDVEEIDDACKENILKYTENISDDELGHIRQEYFISNTKDDPSVFQQIRENILHLARTMRTWNTDYPLKFIQLENRLQEKKKVLPIISFQEIQNIAIDTPQPLNDEELRLFLEFHHEIRALVYFNDLPSYIILDTQWLSDVFRCIVTAKKFSAISIRNKNKWKELYSRGKLHSEVLDDIFRKSESIFSKHKDHILNVMEKFDIIIRPNTSETQRDAGDDKPLYYLPCMIKSEPECDIYKMFNVTENICTKSTWLCYVFRFLPPHLMNHLIASLCRKYNVAEVVTKEQKRQITLFRSSAVFELQKTTKLRKLLIMKGPNIIQIQIWQFGKQVTVDRGLFKYIADFVTEEISKLISTRFKMSNVRFELKWECGQTKPECVTGSFDLSEDQENIYYCKTCTTIHTFTGEWLDLQHKTSDSSENVPRSNLQIESSSQTQTTVQSTKVRVRVQAGEREFSNVNERATGTAISTGFTEEEINFTKMGMIALNIFADVLYDLLKPDKPHLRPRCDCDITYLYSEHRKLNKHVPSNSNHRQYPHGPWGGCWQDFKNTDIAIGDDIERIRLTRNELQHYQLFKLDEMRFNELSNISSDLLKRFDRHNTPTKLYTDRLMEILAKSISKEEVKSIENKISGMTIEVEIEY
ncbi:uncharacterized protein [Mytilus edulis]|uniref:uncharacterized protein n=1 Tax=Mytilus edulis TaxID=6550 RepID=UPI0039F107A2